jgi:hypothetical protein
MEEEEEQLTVALLKDALMENVEVMVDQEDLQYEKESVIGCNYEKN